MPTKYLDGGQNVREAHQEQLKHTPAMLQETTQRRGRGRAGQLQGVLLIHIQDEFSKVPSSRFQLYHECELRAGQLQQYRYAHQVPQARRPSSVSESLPVCLSPPRSGAATFAWPLH